VQRSLTSLWFPLSTQSEYANIYVRSLRYVNDAKVLYEKLCTGHQRIGNLRIPIAGDTTRLHLAEGLTGRQKRMARAQGYLQSHFPGTQAVRRTMYHRHWGARIEYGDCLFFTITPNEHHSSLVLRISRVRRNDPCLQGAPTTWRKLCGMEYHSGKGPLPVRTSGLFSADHFPLQFMNGFYIYCPQTVCPES